ncbi:MAG: hypothetical protein IKL55_00750 [Clostridia bacterium]|nr:hypothetical protein [Clostridia bacterium]
MNKFEIEASIKEKYNDEYTIKMFTNFVWEFQECFSDIMSTEEVIDRVKKNVFGNIRFVDEFDNKRLDGRYAEDGYIYLKKSAVENERYVKYLLFHEMLHAVTSVRDENGNEIMLGFSYLKNSLGMGLNEAMTEYLTQIRNEKFEENSADLISGYRTIVEQIRRLALIIGDKELKKSYFYSPEALKELLNNNRINYDEIELAYRNLCGKDDDVYLTGHGKRLNNNENYKLHRFSEMIFNNYTKVIGEVKSLEDLTIKYKIFQTYVDGGHDCVITMLIAYYKAMGKDVDSLLKKGVSFDEIKKSLQGLNINFNVLANMYSFSKCFVDDKNESAVKLYEFYKRNPNLYISCFSQNCGAILDYFSECDVNPRDDKLYDAWRYPFIGQLLKDHPEIDFADVSYDFIEERNSKINMFVFSSSNGKKYAYTMNAETVTQYIDDAGNENFEVNVNDKCKCKLIFQKNAGMRYSFTATNDFDLKEFMKNVDFRIRHNYSEKEDIEYWIKEGFDEDGSLAQKLKVINKRIEDRRASDFFDL